jgi:hypothetical protein
MFLSTAQTPATSVDFWCFDTVFRIVRTMADEGTFSAVGDEQVPSVHPEAVIRRFNRRPSRDEARRTGERALNLPGFIVTYLGHSMPVASGENCADDGVVRILVQLVDDGDDDDSPRAASSLRWLEDIRRAVLTHADTGLSPLKDCPPEIGLVYHVHVTEKGPPDETDWGFQEQLRMGMQIQCFTRTER